MRMVGDRANGQNYDSAAVDTSLKAADYCLIAHALAGGHSVVTHAVTSKFRIMIPNACIGLGVMWLTLFEVLRRERARFFLRASL